MKNAFFVYIFGAIILIGILLSKSVLSGAGDDLSNSDYHKLCGIYGTVVKKSMDLSLKEMEIAESVQNKLPGLFNKLYVYVIWTNAVDRYQLIKDYAEQQNNIIWECEIARTYYASEFGNK